MLVTATRSNQSQQEKYLHELFSVQENNTIYIVSSPSVSPNVHVFEFQNREYILENFCMYFMSLESIPLSFIWIYHIC
jgi:hypothetical protein